MNIRTLQRGLKYCGRVAAVRQTYHVFASPGYYFVLSFARARARRGSGYFNLVDRAAVDYVQQRVGGTRGVTAKRVLAAARRTRYVPTRLLALNVLYVLVALDRASITRAGENRQLFFSVRKAPRR
ncbi:MAG TPA: hypothetical protein VED45_01045 [Steroidobacteraceae bacterium]|nr:hypothetical protein [Steroidobacteraceae bacterium]